MRTFFIMVLLSFENLEFFFPTLFETFALFNMRIHLFSGIYDMK